jgi:hypothetical protein
MVNIRKTSPYIKASKKSYFYKWYGNIKKWLGKAIKGQQVIVHLAETGTGQSMYYIDDILKLIYKVMAIMLDASEQ